MRTVPIVFCFDDHLLLPAGVSIFSLLDSAHADTFYDIFILHTSKDVYPTSGFLEQLKGRFTNFKLNYRNVGNVFEKAFEIRGITTAAYHRLLIPEIIPEYDKIMYHDVDVVFREDLSAIFEETDLNGYYVAGVVWTPITDHRVKTEITKLGLIPDEYILSGNLLLNTYLLRKDGVVARFKEEVRQSSYKYQDQDIINLVCKGKIKKLPPRFCMSNDAFYSLAYHAIEEVYTKADLVVGYEKGIVHYNGPKPWVTWTLNFDIWWACYRKSVFFDPVFYFSFYERKLNEHDRLSLWKRLKILARYFIHGRIVN